MATLEDLVFLFEGFEFRVKPIAVGRKRDYLFRVPVQITFPNGKCIQSGNCFDSGKGVLILPLIEDHELAKYYPKELEKAKSNPSAYNEKWDSYKLQVSASFAKLFYSGCIEKQFEDR